MNKKNLKDGFVLLCADNGIYDTRNGKVYSEVVCKECSTKYFKEYKVQG